MKPQFLLAAPLIALCGCASQPQDLKVAQTQKPECEISYTVGSMLPRKNCSPPLSDEDRERLQDELRNQVHANASAPPGGGK